jgi:hypothetical protein
MKELAVIMQVPNTKQATIQLCNRGRKVSELGGRRKETEETKGTCKLKISKMFKSPIFPLFIKGFPTDATIR